LIQQGHTTIKSGWMAKATPMADIPYYLASIASSESFENNVDGIASSISSAVTIHQHCASEVKVISVEEDEKACDILAGGWNAIETKTSPTSSDVDSIERIITKLAHEGGWSHQMFITNLPRELLDLISHYCGMLICSRLSIVGLDSMNHTK
jgi:hypothetical protein